MDGHWNAIIGLVLLVLYFLLSSAGKKKDKARGPLRAPERVIPKRASQPQNLAHSIDVRSTSQISLPMGEAPSAEGKESRARRLFGKNSLKEAILMQEILSPPLSQREDL